MDLPVPSLYKVTPEPRRFEVIEVLPLGKNGSLTVIGILPEPSPESAPLITVIDEQQMDEILAGLAYAVVSRPDGRKEIQLLE